jgi:hypothetical protein
MKGRDKGGRKIEGELQPQGFLYTSEILSYFIHFKFTRRLNHLDDNKIQN